jgi:hypothetical protein
MPAFHPLTSYADLFSSLKGHPALQQVLPLLRLNYISEPADEVTKLLHLPISDLPKLVSEIRTAKQSDTGPHPRYKELGVALIARV